jgi:hypothetical protein
MDITNFRQRKQGPEALLEDSVVKRIPDLFCSGDLPCWAAGPLPVGAGMPDLIIASCHPQVFVLVQNELTNAQILAYLRAVDQASLDSIAENIGRPHRLVDRYLCGLIEAEAVSSGSHSFSLAPNWRDILPEVITVEVKVSNWSKALEQANRNRIFAHRSFIALPCRVAERVKSQTTFQDSGIGLLSVGEYGEVSVLWQASHSEPCVWSYYYQFALKTAKHFQESEYAVHRSFT